MKDDRSDQLELNAAAGCVFLMFLLPLFGAALHVVIGCCPDIPVLAQLAIAKAVSLPLACGTFAFVSFA